MDSRPAKEKVMLYRRGFKDGAGSLAKRHEKDPSYERGYADGHWSLGQNVRAFCDDIGYNMTNDVLRTEIQTPTE